MVCHVGSRCNQQRQGRRPCTITTDRNLQVTLFAGFAAWSEWRSSFGTKSSGKFRDSNRTCALSEPATLRSLSNSPSKIQMG